MVRGLSKAALHDVQAVGVMLDFGLEDAVFIGHGDSHDILDHRIGNRHAVAVDQAANSNINHL